MFDCFVNFQESINSETEMKIFNINNVTNKAIALSHFPMAHHHNNIMNNSLRHNVPYFSCTSHQYISLTKIIIATGCLQFDNVCSTSHLIRRHWNLLVLTNVAECEVVSERRRGSHKFVGHHLKKIAVQFYPQSTMARQQRTNSSKQGGRRRRYSNDGDSREEYSSATTTTNNGVAHTNNTTSVAAAVSSQAYSSKKSEDCKGTSPARDVGVVQNNNSTINNNNNTTTTTSQSSSIPSSTTNSSTTSTTSKDEVIPAKLSQENSYFGLNQDEFINAFSSVIQEISSQGDMIPIEAQQKTQFHTSLPPRISLRKYLDRIIKFAFCSAECYILRYVVSTKFIIIHHLSTVLYIWIGWYNRILIL